MSLRRAQVCPVPQQQQRARGAQVDGDEVRVETSAAGAIDARLVRSRTCAYPRELQKRETERKREKSGLCTALARASSSYNPSLLSHAASASSRTSPRTKRCASVAVLDHDAVPPAVASTALAAEPARRPTVKVVGKVGPAEPAGAETSRGGRSLERSGGGGPGLREGEGGRGGGRRARKRGQDEEVKRGARTRARTSAICAKVESRCASSAREKGGRARRTRCERKGRRARRREPREGQEGR